MDVLIFCGQSNMQGSTEGCPAENEPVQGALEYKVQTDGLVPLKHPVGENLGTFLFAAAREGGSLVPDFCRAYYAETGKECVAIHVAKGGSTIGEWRYGTQRYYHSLNKIKAGLVKIRQTEEVDKIYLVWLQGESDAIIGTSENEYLSRLYELKNSLKKDVQIDKFGIIRVGHFISIVEWEMGITQEQKIEREEAIMRAQERAVQEDSDFVMLTRVCKELSLNPANLNNVDPGHFNNAALEIIGKEAGKALGKLRNN